MRVFPEDDFSASSARLSEECAGVWLEPRLMRFVAIALGDGC